MLLVLFPCSSVSKEYACNAGDSNPRSGRSPGEGNGNPLQHSCLWRRKQTELDSILVQAANFGLNAWSPSQWTLNFAPGVYRNGIPKENQTLRNKETQDLDLDSP